MENLSRLLDYYKEDERTERILKKLKTETSARILLKGLKGAQDCFVIASVYHAHPTNHLVIVNNKEEAAYLQNNITGMLGTEPVYFFPDSFKRPAEYSDLNASNTLQRTEIINKVTSSKKKSNIIVTYPEAIFEKVVSPEVLKASRIQIAKGEELDTDTLIEVLVEYGVTVFGYRSLIYARLPLAFGQADASNFDSGTKPSSIMQCI